ncbi:MAG: hypothetical protein ISR50_16855 [Alphaproteobacteria bacterium]|nr:hypothetical protein [Alphaproteobacteria bacterium]
MPFAAGHHLVIGRDDAALGHFGTGDSFEESRTDILTAGQNLSIRLRGLERAGRLPAAEVATM